jgi:hypothetical protein
MNHTTRHALMLFAVATVGLSAPLRAEDAALPVPVPPDALGATFNEDIKQEMFATSKTPKEVAKFYHDLATQKGWQEQNDGTATPDLISLTYSDKGKPLFTVTTIPGADQLMVSISGPLLGTPE